MTCARYEGCIALAAGGDLQPRRQRRLQRHLLKCERCRGYAAAMSRAREVFQELSDEPAGRAELAAVRAGVMARIAEEDSAARRFAWRWALAPVAAAAVLITVFWARVPDGMPSSSVARRTPLSTGSAGATRGPRADEGVRPTSARGSAGSATLSTQPAARPTPVLVRTAGEALRPGSLRRIQGIAPREPDGDIVVRLETSDPKVVIYWVMQSGETE